MNDPGNTRHNANVDYTDCVEKLRETVVVLDWLGPGREELGTNLPEVISFLRHMLNELEEEGGYGIVSGQGSLIGQRQPRNPS